MEMEERKDERRKWDESPRLSFSLAVLSTNSCNITCNMSDLFNV